jgi:hypothetical protein
MRKTNRHKKINGRKRRTLKMRGGDLDDPDTKDFMNSKFEALEQKITELENNIPVYIGYSDNSGPIYAPKDADTDMFKYILNGFGINMYMTFTSQNNVDRVFISLQKIYSIPKIRKIVGFSKNQWGGFIGINFPFTPLEEDDRILVTTQKYGELMEKYPGLFYL